MEWKYGINNEVLVADDGEILAEVSAAFGTGYYGIGFGKNTKYFTEKQAKEAMEKLAKDYLHNSR